MKKYHITINLDFNDISELAHSLGTLIAELFHRATDSGEYEENEVGLGFEIEANENAEYAIDLKELI